MTSNELTARRYVFPDLAIIEIYNPDAKIWDYFLNTKENANLVYVVGTEVRLTDHTVRNLWKKGYFEKFREDEEDT